MSNAPALLSIAEVLEIPPGDETTPTWVNGEIKALVAVISPKTSQKGKQFWAIVFADETTNRMQVETTVFTAPKFSVGDIVIITGSGIRRTQYNDKAQIALSAKSEIHVLGRAVAAQTPSNNPSQAYAAAPPPAVGSFIPNGASVGMAVKEALALTVDEGTTINSPDFYKRVYKHSSDILRLMHTLESGRLAPKTGAAPAPTAETPPPAEAPPERSTPPRAATRPQPGPDGSVKHNPNDDDDVPF